MKALPKKIERRAGFTLTEVMAAMSIFLLLSGGVLKTYDFLSQTIHNRILANENLAQIRYFTQFFRQQVNAAQQQTLVQEDEGKRLVFSRYLVASNAWETATLQYRSDTKELLYSSGGQSKTLLTQAEPFVGLSEIFSIESSVVHCRLRVGKDEKLRAVLDTKARPRNP